MRYGFLWLGGFKWETYGELLDNFENKLIEGFDKEV